MFAPSILVGLAAIILLADFAERSAVAPLPSNAPRTGIVFTGQFDRVEAGLRLMQEAAIDRLFISGVNPGAGIRLDRFSDQFQLSPGLRADLHAGRIKLAPVAENTFENALETACWLAGRPDVGDVILITGQWHMPRASLALERAAPRVVGVTRLSIPEAAPASAVLGEEALKFLATWAMTLLPTRLWPGDWASTCP